uniref:mitogen-activated protein kinase kinase n=1 Tax=Aceria tosichella TaxID=561515 RepID=A0A6G1SKH9_9ACAR
MSQSDRDMQAWPRTRMRLDQLARELSTIDSPPQQPQPPRSISDDDTFASRITNLNRNREQSQSQQTNSVNRRLSSEFEKNKFFVSPNEPPITTTLQPEEVFEELDLLGTGSGGCVLKMRHKPSGKICAVKQMRRTLNEEENKRIYMDLQVVLQCECDNIVRCCGYFIKEAEVWICMELMTTCFDKLLRSRERRPLPEKFIGAIAASAVKALYYLKEKHNIIHRDVKPSNILIDDLGQIKLCDFGISGRLIDSIAKTKAAGCIAYMAPERIDLSYTSYDIRADVWSLGVTLYELATGESPYAQFKTDFDILVNIVAKSPPSLPRDREFSEELIDFISVCLTKDFRQRPKYKQLMEHDFIKRHKDTVVSLSELD